MALANINRAAFGHTGNQQLEFHSTGQPALFILVHAGPTTALFPCGKDNFIRPEQVEKKKIIKNVRKLTFLRRNMTIARSFGFSVRGDRACVPEVNWQRPSLDVNA